MIRLGLVALFFTAACSAGQVLEKAAHKDISSKMSAAQPSFQACYTDALIKDENARGKLTLSFQANPVSGRFEKVKVGNTSIKDAEFSTCVANAVSNLRLSVPPGRLVVVDAYAISFSPAK